MLEKNKQFFSYFMASLSVFFWASAFPAIKYCLEFYSPESITWLRFTVASVVLLVIGLRSKIKMPERADWPYFIAGGFIGIFLYMWLLNTGTGMAGVGVSSFIIASAPVFALLLAMVFLKEKANAFTWLGVFTSAAGLAMIAYSKTGGFSLDAGIIVLLATALCAAIYNIIQRKVLHKYSPLESTVYMVVIGTLFALVFLPGFAGEFAAAPLKADLLIVYMGVFPAGFAYLFWSYALYMAKNTTNVVMFLYLTPFVAIIMTFFLLGELIPLLAFAGGVVIIAGMLIASRFGV